MSIGRMDRQIVIEQNTPTQDSVGEEIESWATLATVWAEYLPVGGREFWAARQINAETVANFRIHYRSDVTRGMRLTFDGDTYDIVDANEDRRMGYKEFLLIRGEARVS